MQYWLDLFTGTTWQEFWQAGANVSGFREGMRSAAKRVQPGDVFLCYLTGVMRWIGALEVISSTKDDKSIWKGEQFPVRFEVKTIVLLKPEHGVPLKDLEGRLSFYQGASDRGKFKGFLRGSPNLFRKQEDAQLILSLLREAADNPVSRPVDAKQLARRPAYKAILRSGKDEIRTVVSVPEPETSPSQAVGTAPVELEPGTPLTKHTEIQHLLVKLGAEMGLSVWVARNDRSRVVNGVELGKMKGVVDELPVQFKPAAHKTVELIDVIWLKEDSYVAAFEVESTTSVYSGLLRMSDLLALQKNLDIKLYIVAPDDRREKVEQEILRPTFALTTLRKACGFLSFSTLEQTAKAVFELGIVSSLSPDFLLKKAEFFTARSELT